MGADHGAADQWSKEISPAAGASEGENWDETWWLADAEQRLLRNSRRWHQARSSERWDIWQQSLDIVSQACGYPHQTAMWRISKDFQCSHFRSMPRRGRDQHQQNEDYSLGNHITMVNDRFRVEAYRAALDNVARGQHALDVGCGPFCLLSRLALQAGAMTVDSVEQNRKAVHHAVNIFKGESFGQETEGLHKIGASLVGYDVSFIEHSGGNGMPWLSLYAAARQWPFERKLQLFQGFSSDAPLPGGYNLVIHEILGHIASSEGVVDALNSLRHRGLLAQDCVFVPRRAATLFVPTMKIELSCLERILYLGSGVECSDLQGSNLQCLRKYNTDRFPKRAFLASPEVFEDLNFCEYLQTTRQAVVEFVTDCSGIFDGLHFHMVVDMDGQFSINTLQDQTSWCTTYVKLLDAGIFLPVGSHIICKTWIELNRPDPLYSIAVSVEGKPVAEFSWSGCTG